MHIKHYIIWTVHLPPSLELGIRRRHRRRCRRRSYCSCVDACVAPVSTGTRFLFPTHFLGRLVAPNAARPCPRPRPRTWCCIWLRCQLAGIACRHSFSQVFGLLEVMHATARIAPLLMLEGCRGTAVRAGRQTRVNAGGACTMTRVPSPAHSFTHTKHPRSVLPGDE